MKDIYKYIVLTILILSCSISKNNHVIDAHSPSLSPGIHTILSGDLQIFFDQNMHSRINMASAKMPLMKSAFPSEYIVSQNKTIEDFDLKTFHSQTFKDKIGSGIQYTLKGKNEKFKIEKVVTIKTYDVFLGMAFFDVKYFNKGKTPIKISKWVNHQYHLSSNDRDSLFWSFQGSSTSERNDWISPVGDSYFRKNYMGMNNSDYGGGIPIIDIWRSDAGIAIGHTSFHPELVSLPVEKILGDDLVINIQKTLSDDNILKEGESMETVPTFVMVHHGDCFNTLKAYTRYMSAQGMTFPESEAAAYEPVWCAWGYGRTFTIDQIIGTLPKVSELGFKWAVIDDGFQKGEGDWMVNPEKFPQGPQQIKALVDSIHSYGLKAKLWWAPLAVDPCTDLIYEHPDIILYTDEWIPRIISWWDAYYMAPSYEVTRKHTAETIEMFLDDWGFDGLKMDGQHMNAVPPDHHPKHHPDDPEKSCRELPAFFKFVYKKAKAIKPHAVIENCPCGCVMSYYHLPYINQTVSSDPLSSKQIRQKGKVYKAIVPHTAYYGDHVELSDGGDDFASTIGVGGVPGSKFTWPKDNPDSNEKFLLTPQKEVLWKKWIGLYDDLMLSKGEYLGDLYDIGFDKPEGHVIRKDGSMYYAFFSNQWNGKIELRGLDKSSTYRVFDYENNKYLGTVVGPNPTLNIKFQKHLMLKLTPIN